MTRSLDPNALITLPRLDANQAVVLALQFEGAATDETGKPRDLPEPIAEALADVKADRAALQDAMSKAPESDDVRVTDKLEDNAIAALLLILTGWSRVRGQLELGDVAAKVAEYLGAQDGLGFINLRARDEYGVVDTKLKTIDREKLEPMLGDLGLAPLLAHLRDVHARYGAALGMTQALPVEQHGAVRAVYDALLDSLKHYVGAVVGSVQRKKPATKALADTLLGPLASWKSDAPRKTTKDEAETPGTAPTPV